MTEEAFQQYIRKPETDDTDLRLMIVIEENNQFRLMVVDELVRRSVNKVLDLAVMKCHEVDREVSAEFGDTYGGAAASCANAILEMKK